MIRTAAGLIKNWKIILGVSVAVGLGTYMWIQNSRINSLTDDLAVSQQNVAILKGAVETQRKTIDHMSRQYQQMLEFNQEYQERIADLREEQQEIMQQYNRYRGRLQELTLERPETIERLVNREFKRVLEEFTETTTRNQRP